MGITTRGPASDGQQEATLLDAHNAGRQPLVDGEPATRGQLQAPASFELEAP